MLYRIKDTRESDSGYGYRCYGDEYFDLFLWYDNGRIIQFQLVYNKFKRAHALTWHEERGYLHARVDEGNRPRKKMSPILVMDGEFPKEFLVNKFREESMEIEAGISSFVMDKLRSI